MSPVTVNLMAPHEALIAAQLEIRDLQAAISAMREELEAREQAAAAQAEAVRARAEAEIHDLQATIVRLRQELEEIVTRNREQAAAQTRDLRATIDHHVQTIRVLRERLEAAAHGSGGTP